MIVLDGANMDSREALHAELKAKLSLPDYYGGNLDALNDCLSERRGRELIVIEDATALLAAQDGYAARLLRVLSENGLQVLLD